jgi:hypothetical protein
MGFRARHIGWMKVTITLLTPHPNDPEYRARQAMDHPQA